MGLCTLEEVKEYNGITDTTNDTLLTNLIERVSDGIETFCDRNFESQSYTEYHSGGKNNDRFYTNQYPIITGSGVEVWDDYDWDWTTDDLVDSDDYMVTDNRYIVLNNSVFLDGVNNIKVSYTAGYDVIPTDLTQFTIEEVIRKFKSRRHPGDIKSKSLPDGTVVYNDVSGLPDDISILNSYKRKYVVC